MLDEDHQCASGASPVRHLIDSTDDLLRLEGIMLAFAKALLDIDNKERGIHAWSVSGRKPAQFELIANGLRPFGRRRRL